LRVIPDGNAPEGVDEVRGEFWDLGRMKADDPRLAGRDLRALFHVDPDAAWPRPGEVMVIMASAIAASPQLAGPPSAPIRAVVLDVARFIGQTVTISGQYQGRNLTGDLPAAPGRTRYDFVLRSGDAAIWVTNLRPKGKDARGRDFELGLDARIDTGRWLQITGTVRQARGLVWIDGDAGSLALTEAPPAAPNDESAVVLKGPSAPAPEVIFSTPTGDETDVPATTNVRLQFSRDIDPQTIKGHIRATYVGDASAPAVELTTDYGAPGRVIEVKFVKPLERFKTVKVEIVDGLLGTDQQAVKPWALTFSIGGS
jgi:hypothetical protein